MRKSLTLPAVSSVGSVRRHGGNASRRRRKRRFDLIHPLEDRDLPPDGSPTYPKPFLVKKEKKEEKKTPLPAAERWCSCQNRREIFVRRSEPAYRVSEYWPSLSLPPPPPRRRRRRRTISSSPSATPRSCTRRCPTNPPSSTLLDATSCSACLAACREKARPVLVKINQPYPKVILHYSKKTIVAHRIHSKRLGSNSDKGVLVLLVLLHTPLAATVFFLLKKKILHQHFFFGKYLDQRGVPSVSVWQPASPSRSQALPARALHVRNFHPFFYLFGSSRQGGITQPQKPKLHG